MKRKIIKELRAIEAYLYEHSDGVISERIAKNVPLSKSQQDHYFGKKSKRKVLKNFK